MDAEQRHMSQSRTTVSSRMSYDPTTPFPVPENRDSKKAHLQQCLRRKQAILTSIIAILLIAALAMMTSDYFVGRRCAKIISYRLDIRYWPSWYSIILWTTSVGLLNVLLLRYKLFQDFYVRIFRSSAGNSYDRMISYRVALCYIVLAVIVVFWQFVDVKPFWRYLRYKVYADYFQNPVLLLIEHGRFSTKLFTGPFLIVLFVLYRMLKKNSTKLFNVFILLCLSNVSLIAQEDGENKAPKKRIQLLQQAEHIINSDVQTISATPSAKNPDGGYDANISILQCFAVMSYLYSGNTQNREETLFRMRFPLHMEQGRKYPLIVWFHGLGENTNDNTRHLAHLHHGIASFVGKDALDFYAIAVQYPSDERENARLDLVGEIMEAVIKEYPVDENRIGIIGISSGATASWDFVERHPEKIAGLVAFSGTPRESLSPNAFKKTAVWAFNNKGDVGVSWKRTSEFIDQINATGGNGYVTLREHGIHDSWSYPLKNENVIRWLISQSLNGDGLLQNAQYPKRSFFTICLLFLLPITINISLLIILKSVH